MKMDFKSISRQKAWMRGIQFTVDNISPLEETPYGFCQTVTATDSRGVTECMNYFFEHLEVQIDPAEIGEQFYDVKWDVKKGLYRCIPATPPIKDELKPDRPDWDAIARGKIRHGVVCAMLQAKLNPFDIINEKELRDCINSLTEFISTGEIGDERPN